MGIKGKKAKYLTNRSPGAMGEALESRLFLSASQSAQDQAIQFLSTSSAVFVQNQGQWPDAGIKYAYDGQGINIGFSNTGPVLELERVAKPAPATDPASVDPLARTQTPPEIDQTRVAVSFDNAQATAPIGIDQSSTSFNYLVGDASQHRSNVPGYQKIEYPSLYPGIDLLTWAQPAGMKYEFHVAPGADWRNIQVTYSGANGMSLAADGSLHIATPLGDLVEQAPVLYQIVDGKRVTVAGEFVLQNDQTYRFSVTGQYDPSRELVIDPNLAWATYLPGYANEAAAVAVDGSGNVYATGYSVALDVFVAKLDPTGSRMLYMTYFGGTGFDKGLGVAVDAFGDAYVVGNAQSTGLATPGAYQVTFGGGQDAFVAKLNPSGSSLLYATYLGGAGVDYGYAIAIDGAGEACIVGQTASAGLATAGAYNTTYLGGPQVFVAKIDAAGSSLIYATYLNGGIGLGIAVDSTGNAYVTGRTSSNGWATDGAFDTELSGSADAFVVKLNALGSELLYAAYLGGSQYETGFAIAVDHSGDAYVAGVTNSVGWATPGAAEVDLSGDTGFVAKINASGSSLLYVTYVGSQDQCNGIAIDTSGNAYVTGYTTSGDWATSDAYNTTENGNWDLFIAKIAPTGASILYATYLGGSGLDTGLGLAVDLEGNAYVAGRTTSSGFATPGAFQTVPTFPTSNVPFVLKFSGIVDLFPGDTNGDGQVNFADLVAVAQNYGGSNKTRAQGDVTGDGNVTFADLVSVAQNYGLSASAPATSPQLAAVPAPAAASPASLTVAPTQSATPVPNSVATPLKPKPIAAAPAKVSPIVPRITPAPIQPPLKKSTAFNSRKRIGDAVWNR